MPKTKKEFISLLVKHMNTDETTVNKGLTDTQIHL